MWLCYYALLLLFSAFSWSFRDEKQKIWSFLWKKLRKDKDYPKNFVILRPILVVMSCRYWRMNSVTAHNAIDSPRRAEGDMPEMVLWLKRATSGSAKQNRMRWERESLLYVGKAFTQRFIATLQTSNTWNPCSRCSNGRWPGMCVYASPFVITDAAMYRVYLLGVLYSYRRGLRSCLS